LSISLGAALDLERLTFVLLGRATQHSLSLSHRIPTLTLQSVCTSPATLLCCSWPQRRTRHTSLLPARARVVSPGATGHGRPAVPALRRLAAERAAVGRRAVARCAAAVCVRCSARTAGKRTAAVEQRLVDGASARRPSVLATAAGRQLARQRHGRRQQQQCSRRQRRLGSSAVRCGHVCLLAAAAAVAAAAAAATALGAASSRCAAGLPQPAAVPRPISRPRLPAAPLARDPAAWTIRRAAPGAAHVAVAAAGTFAALLRRPRA
jgi:hypothetical protein